MAPGRAELLLDAVVMASLQAELAADTEGLEERLVGGNTISYVTMASKVTD